jgi:hypothetical protein
MQQRLARDQAVRTFMKAADEVKQEHGGLGPLCGVGPSPPPFSLEEAIIWRDEEHEEGAETGGLITS